MQISWRDALDIPAVMQLGLRLVLVLLLWWLLSRMVQLVLRRLSQRLVRQASASEESPIEATKRVETLVRLLGQIVRITLLVMLVLIVLMQLGVQIGPLLASAGIVGVAVGFGAQSLVKDVITGFFMVMENQLRVGDVVNVNGTGGLVEAMTLRTVVLRDISGVVHVFPNGNINTLGNLTRSWSAYVFEIGIAYKENPDVAIAALREIAAEMRADEYYGARMIDAAEIYGVDQLADSAVIIKGRLRTPPMQQWEVGREFLRRVKLGFDARGIEIPFPHRTLYLANNAMQSAVLASLSAMPAKSQPLVSPREEADGSD